jgi:long-chain-fatty-acyl-CoA reductase
LIVEGIMAESMAPTRVLDIPLVLDGVLHAADPERVVELAYEDGLVVRVPELTHGDIDELARTRKSSERAVGEMSMAEVTAFLSRVGRRWQQGCEGRRIVEEWAPKLTGLPAAMVEADCLSLGEFLTRRWHVYDQVAAEFSNELFFDEWTAGPQVLTRGFPRGTVLHYLVGNVPLAAMYTLIRGIITKNRNVAKLPSRDPATAWGFVHAMLETEPDHPVARSLSLAYWPHESEVGRRCLDLADAVCVWGGRDALESIKRSVPAGVPIAEYGPRWSAAAIDLDLADPERAAFRLAEDACFYDQEACLNVQRAFVRGDVASFVPVLERQLEAFARRYPFVSRNPDASAHRAASLLEANYLGWPVSEGDGWAVVVAEDPAAVREHPLGRVIFIHPVDDLGSVTDHLGRGVQTLSVYPWALTERYRDEWGRAADRIVDLGFARLPRTGFSHDGGFGLHPLVRIVSVEREGLYAAKYGDVPLDPAVWERAWFATDAVP